MSSPEPTCSFESVPYRYPGFGRLGHFEGLAGEGPEHHSEQCIHGGGLGEA